MYFYKPSVKYKQVHSIECVKYRPVNKCPFMQFRCNIIYQQAMTNIS